MNLVGERIQEARIASSLSQAALAEKIGHITNNVWWPTRDDIYRIESGTRTCSDLEAIAIAVALGKEIEWLIKGDDLTTSTFEVANRIFGPQQAKQEE